MNDGLTEAIFQLQDAQSLKSALLQIQDALETGYMPKSFTIWNDDFVSTTMSHICGILKEKYGIKVPDSEI